MQQFDEIRRGNYTVNLLPLMLMSSASTLSIITLNCCFGAHNEASINLIYLVTYCSAGSGNKSVSNCAFSLARNRVIFVVLPGTEGAFCSMWSIYLTTYLLLNKRSLEGTNKQYTELQLAMINQQVGGVKGIRGLLLNWRVWQHYLRRLCQLHGLWSVWLMPRYTCVFLCNKLLFIRIKHRK